MDKGEFESEDISKLTSISGLFGHNPDSDANFKIHQFSIEHSFSSRKVLLQPFMEDFKLAVVKKYEFGNLHVIINKNFGILGLSRSKTKKKHWH